MNKSYILTALGVVGSSLLTINANADTIYMCKACKSGTYANNNKCETCPAGSYCIDGKKYACGADQVSAAGASSCTTCKAGTYIKNNKCETCPVGYYCPDGKKKYGCYYGQYQNETGKSSCKACPGTPIKVDVSLTYQQSYYGAVYVRNKTTESQNLKGYNNSLYNFTGWKDSSKEDNIILFTGTRQYNNVQNLYFGKINGKEINVSKYDTQPYIFVTCDEITGGDLKAILKSDSDDIIIYSK